MSFVKTTFSDADDLEHENGRIRQELMRLRSSKTRESENKAVWYKWDREKYDIRPIGPGYPTSWNFPIDPKRRVAAQWKKLSFEGPGSNLVFWSDGTPENFEVVEGSEGPLKVRWLRNGLKTGAVENLPILEYIWARAAGFNMPSNPKVEPVPDDEPECPGWRPAEIPSSIKKAREIVAKALKKNPEQLTVTEVISYFESRASKSEKFIEAITQGTAT